MVRMPGDQQQDGTESKMDKKGKHCILEDGSPPPLTSPVEPAMILIFQRVAGVGKIQPIISACPLRPANTLQMTVLPHVLTLNERRSQWQK